MSGSVNKAIIIGNVGVDPEIKSTTTGAKLAKFSVATNEKWKDKDQNLVEKTEWHRVVIFGPKAEIAERYLRKGSLVAIEGAIRSNKWTDNDGNERDSVEVHITQGNGNFTILGSRNEKNQPPDEIDTPSPKAEDDDLGAIPF